MLDFNDLSPFAADLTEAQARLVIEDVEGELARIAPTLLDSADPAVIRILRVAALRHFDYLRSGGRRTTRHEQIRGPFTELNMASPTDAAAQVDLFTPVEVQKLNELAAIPDAVSLIAAPVGQFPLPGGNGYRSGSFDYTYPATGGVNWLGQ
jgi:hypothetical protein